MSKYSAFISYRKINETSADLVEKSLVEEHGFNKDEIFLDKNKIGPEYFDVKLKKSVINSSCLVLIVTKGCFIPKEDDEDWFIEEIRTALERNINIIPVLFDGIKSLKSEEILVELRKSFNDSEIERLVKFQAIPYHFELSDATFQKLASYVRTSDKPTVVESVLRCGSVIAILLVVLAVVLASFFGIGYLWGTITSGDSFEEILVENTHLDGSTAVFEFCGLEAQFNLDLDTVIINLEEFNGKLPQSNYENLANSCSVSGALLLFNKNLKNLKYVKFLKGGSKQSKLVAVGLTVTIFAGSFCGFSQGSESARVNKQRENVELFYHKLKDKELWAPVFADNIILKAKYNLRNNVNVLIWCEPSEEYTTARDSGLVEKSLLLKYNNWEIGKAPYSSLIEEIDISADKPKDVIIMEVYDDSVKIKQLSLPSGIVGIIFNAPLLSTDVSNPTSLFNEWKTNNGIQ